MEVVAGCLSGPRSKKLKRKSLYNGNRTYMEVIERGVVRCADVPKLFGDYVEGDLPPTLKMFFEGHIQGCPTCSKFKDSYLNVMRTARAIGERPLPEGARERLHDALNKRLGLKLPVGRSSSAD